MLQNKYINIKTYRQNIQYHKMQIKYKPADTSICKYQSKQKEKKENIGYLVLLEENSISK